MKKIFAVTALLLLACLTSAQEESEKVIVMQLRIDDQGISEVSTDVVYGLPPDIYPSENEYTAAVKDASGKTLKKFSFADPRNLAGDGVGEDGTRIPGSITLPEADFTIIFPYQEMVSSIDVLDSGSKKSLFRKEIVKPLEDFCLNHKEDADCAKKLAETKTQPVKEQPRTSCMPFLTGMFALLGAAIAQKAV